MFLTCIEVDTSHFPASKCSHLSEVVGEGGLFCGMPFVFAALEHAKEGSNALLPS